MIIEFSDFEQRIIFFLIVIITIILIFNPKVKSKKNSTRIKINNYGIFSKTLTGITVRSKAEKKIADFLTKHGIKYQYEPKLRIKRNYFLPDFYLPEFNLIIEYFGLQDLNGREGIDYRINTKKKLEFYKMTTFNFIALYSSDLDNLNQNLLDKLKTYRTKN